MGARYQKIAIFLKVVKTIQMKFCVSLLIFFFLKVGVALSGEVLFREGSLINVAPPVINKDYYLFEYGFVVKKEIKKWKYGYNAFVNASFFEDWKGRSDNLHAGALGFKGGVLFPFSNYPVYYRVATGFAKTALHKNPLFGKEEQSVSKKTMILLEAGLVYKFNNTFAGLSYQINNVKYFKRNIVLSFGVNY